MADHSLRAIARVEDALDELDRLHGWRALLVLPPEAADPDALLGALPWVQEGAARPGTSVRLFQVRHGLLLVTGGALSDEEGAQLFEIHERLKDVVKQVIIMPPPAAAQPLIARMYESGVAPVLPSDKLPNARGWAGLGATALVAAGLTTRVSKNARVPLTPIWATLAVLAVVCGILWWIRDRQLREILSDPFRSAATRWAPMAPSRLARR